MRLIVRTAPVRPAPVDDLRLLTPETSRWDEFGANLVALLWALTHRPKFEPRPMFRAVIQPRWDPRQSMATSVVCHGAIIAVLLNLPAFWKYVQPPDPANKVSLDTHRLEWYRMADQLPAIDPGSRAEKPPQEKGGKRREPAKQGATVWHPQRMVSNPPEPDNSQQTIFQPDAPNIKIQQAQLLPNVVMWHEIEKPAPPVDLVKAPLRMPPELVKRHVDIPEDIPNMERRLGDIKIASALSTVVAPKLEVVPESPPPPPDSAVVVGPNADADARLRRVVVMNVNPAAPSGPIDVPAGQRSGAFSAGPEGKPGGGSNGTPNGVANGSAEGGAGGPGGAGDGTLGGKRELGAIRVPGLAIAGVGLPPVNGPVVAGPAAAPVARAPLPAAPSAAALDPKTLASRTRPPLPDFNSSRIKSEPGFQPGKRVYTVFINMPNLTSGGGGSWVMRFAELEMRAPIDQVDISAPVATRKIDPGYAPDAVRERIEGKVRLHAIIRRDGKVEQVEVLHSLDARLDQRAVDAMSRWIFQPGMRLGQAVDIEAVIEIPFALPKIDDDTSNRRGRYTLGK